jgi:hypothetical protein
MLTKQLATTRLVTRQFAPYDRATSSVLSRLRNTDSVGDEVTDGGRLFQTREAATGKARSPIVEQLVRGTAKSAVAEERSRCRAETTATQRS